MDLQPKKERIFPTLELTDQATVNNTIQTTPQPVLVIQSPKTPTLSRKLKAVSLDSDQPKKQSTNLDVARDVFSMPNTPKRQIKHKLSCDFDGESTAAGGGGGGGGTGPTNKTTLQPNFSTNLKKFASNNSISGSQILKTLPEIMTLQDFSDNNRSTEPIRIKAKGLLERRGSNASLTIDLGSNSSITENSRGGIMPLIRLNTAKSVSNLNLSSYSMPVDKCHCYNVANSVAAATPASTTIAASATATTATKATNERRKSQEACGNCIIYESVPVSKGNCCTKFSKSCNCNAKCRRKSLSNENLYVPPCGFCQTGAYKECTGSTKHCKGYRKACYPRQPDLEANHQLLSEDFKLHLQNVQYLQTAGSLLSINDLILSCEMARVPKLHQEFWEVPLNLQEKCYVSGSQNRNRYRGVLPNEHSRVHLPETQNYIHANYIKGPDYTETAYIATQGPMAHTCQDFWEMVWYSNCNCIVMLTGLIEKGRSKCELYFPLGKKSKLLLEKSFYYVKTTKIRDKFTFDNKTNQIEEEIIEFEELNEIKFDNYIIRYIKEEYLDECIIRDLELIKLNEIRLIKHYWYPNWQDHKMANPEQVLKIAIHLLDNNINKTTTVMATTTTKNISSKKNKNITTTTTTKPNKTIDLKKTKFNEKSPIIVHCSAGIGRTGCFLAILNGIKQLKNNYNVDILAILCSLRLNRGGMVQTAEQYELIHRVLSLYADLLLQKQQTIA